MAVFWQKTERDWCHICGTRQDNCVEIQYPRNAEHQFLSEDTEYSPDLKVNYLRICADCGKTTFRVGNGEMTSAVRNNPALVTAHIKGVSRYAKPEAN
jgi:hypothetical protein